MSRTSALALVALTLLASVSFGEGTARAACNLIPGTQLGFRSSGGTVDHAFASPGDPVEITLGEDCIASGSCFTTSSGSNVVTVLFEPVDAEQKNVVVLAPSCAALAPQLEAFAGCSGVAEVACVDAGADQIFASDTRRLRFVFPDTDAAVGDANDDITWAGPATIAVTGTEDNLPCQLAESCDDSTGTRACVDALLAGSDPAAGAIPDETFARFTALPPPNDFQAICTTPSPPCTGRTRELRFALDSSGNVLLPVDWRGVLVPSSGVPIARLLRGSSPLWAFEDQTVPLRIPGRSFVASYSPEGGRLPPIFDPQAQIAGSDGSADLSDATLFGSVDAPRSVLRIARRAAAFTACVGGPNAGLPCFASVDCQSSEGGEGECLPSTCRSPSGDLGTPCGRDSDCPSGAECGPSLFDFRTRVVRNNGQVVVPLRRCLSGPRSGHNCSRDQQCDGAQCGDFALAALDPVPLDGLNQSEALSAFVVDERIQNQDINGDGDREDDVVVLSDRRTGEVRSIGTEGRKGRALVRVSQPPFSFPAVAIEKDLLAFLESEAQQQARDTSGDGDVADAVLRIFRSGGDDITPATSPALVVDPSPRIDGRSLTLSDGLLVYRRSEAGAARRTTELIGAPASGIPALSGDGSKVAFRSTADGLVAGDTNGGDDVFLFDRATGETERVSVSSDGEQGVGCAFNGCNFFLGMSADGLRTVFSSFFDDLVDNDGNAADDVFLRDLRDASQPRTIRLSEGPGGEPADGDSFTPSLSAGGRYVVFSSVAGNLLPADAPTPDTNFVCLTGESNCEDVFVRDLEDPSGVNELVSVSTSGEQGDAESFLSAASISEDGRFIVFFGPATNLGPAPDANFGQDVFVRDRCIAFGVAVAACAPSTQLAHVDSTGEPGNLSATQATISATGRFVAFESASTNLVAGDTNNATDIFVRDLVAGLTERVSISSAGGQGNHSSRNAALSADGRFVAFASKATNLVPNDTNADQDVFVHDRLTGTTERVSVNEAGRQGNRASGEDLFLAISADGRFVGFASRAPNLAPRKRNNGQNDVFVRGVADGDGPADLFRDGKADDTVLEVLQTSSAALPSTLCPAGDVSAAAGRVAYLRPEASDDGIPTPDCPKGALNGDGDVDDEVVHLWSGGTTSINLGRAAHALVLSDTYLATLVSEQGQGEGPRNGDGDEDDAVVEVFHPLDGGEWHRTRQAADTLDARGNVVAFLTPEADQRAELSGDDDFSDRVLQIYDPNLDPPVRNTGQPAEDFVIGPKGLVAFRTREANLCDGRLGPIAGSTCSVASTPARCSTSTCDLNGDGDCCDDVLQVFDVVRGLVVPSRATVRPCRFEACDPRVPYKMLNDTVTFLSFERDEGCSGGARCFDGALDLNGDLDSNGLVLRKFNARLAGNVAARSGARGLASILASQGTQSDAAPMLQRTLAGVSAGLCTSTGAACAFDEACQGGAGGAPGAVCFIPPGGCIRDLGAPCRFTEGVASDCGADAFCEPIAGQPGDGRCRQLEGSCASTAECAPGAVCNNTGQNLQRLVSPLAQPGFGGEVFTSSGRCLDDTIGACCQADAECGTGEVCDLIDRSASCEGRGACRRDRGICGEALACPTGSHCSGQLLIATAADQDGDEIPDVFDNCKTRSNPMQEDADGDTVGDACETATCGNGIVDGRETCDDGNHTDGDGCDAQCGSSICANGAPLLAAKLTVSGLSGSSGNESLRLMGRIDCSEPGVCDAFDPIANGAQLRIREIGAATAQLLDLTRTSAPVPPGLKGTGCDPLRDGWSKPNDGRRFVYANRSGALPGAGCAAGSAQGLKSLRLTDRRPSHDDIEVRVVVAKAALAVGSGALRAEVVLSANATSATNVCGTRTFDPPSCRRDAGGRSVECR